MVKEPAKDFIDSSIFLGMLFDKDINCEEYLNSLGYKARNIGFTSPLVFGEVLNNIIIRVNYQWLRSQIFNTLTNIIDYAIYQQRLKIIRITKRDLEESTQILEEIEHINQPADAFLIAIAVNNNCDNFVTIDEGIWKLKRRLYDKFRITIKYLKFKQ